VRLQLLKELAESERGAIEVGSLADEFLQRAKALEEVATALAAKAPGLAPLLSALRPWTTIELPPVAAARRRGRAEQLCWAH
jgi:hypothetical protein